MKLTVSLLFLLCCFIQHAHAQDKYFEEGYVIQNSDTTRGYINRKDELSLSQEVIFKPALETTTVIKYAPGEIDGFGFKASNLSFTDVEVVIRNNSKIVKKQKFAKNLLKGTVTLYKVPLLIDERTGIFLKNNNYVYIVKKGTSFHTLGQYEYKVENKVGVDKRYIPMLKALVNDCLDNSEELTKKLRFNDEDITGLIENYNNCKNPGDAAIVYTHKVKPDIKHGAEASYAKLYSPYYSEVLSNSQGYSFGYFWDITKSDISRKFSQRVGANYLYLQYDVPHRFRKEYYRQELHFLRVPLAIQYNFNRAPDEKFTPFLNFGLTGQLSSDSRLSHLDILPFVSLGGGMYFKNLKVYASIENEFFSFYGSKIISLGVGLRFDKNKF